MRQKSPGWSALVTHWKQPYTHETEPLKSTTLRNCKVGPNALFSTDVTHSKQFECVTRAVYGEPQSGSKVGPNALFSSDVIHSKLFRFSIDRSCHTLKTHTHTHTHTHTIYATREIQENFISLFYEIFLNISYEILSLYVSFGLALQSEVSLMKFSWISLTKFSLHKSLSDWSRSLKSLLRNFLRSLSS